MRHRAALALLAAWALPAVGLCAAISQPPIRGTRGEPVARAVVRWSDLALQKAETGPQRAEREADEPMPIPELPVPERALVRREIPALAPERAVELPPSPAPAGSFVALPDNGLSIPPDTHGAAGRSHLVVMLNTQIRIQDRSGAVISTVSLLTFWQRVSGLIDLFDPRIAYDPYGDRWIAAAVAAGSTAQSALLIGVSQTGDPTGSWNLYKIDADSSDLTWVDFPSLGFNKNWIAVQGNMYSISQDADGNSNFQGSKIWVFSRANLYAGGDGAFTVLSNDSIGATQCPAVTLDPSLSALYLLQNWNGNVAGSGYLRLYTITGAVGSEVLTPVTFVATPNPWSSSPPGGADFGPQMGDPTKINLGDGRMNGVVFRNGSIWGAHTVFLPQGAATHSAAQWWQVATDGGVLQRGRMEDLSAAVFYAFPSLAVNKNGDALLGYSSFSAQQFASGNFAYRSSGDPPGVLRSDRLLKAGEDTYVRFFSASRNRWGDYSASTVDPTNDTDLWTIQEYAAARESVSRAYRWGTWWGRVVPEPAAAAPCAAGTATLCLNEGRFRVEVAWRAPAQGTAGIGTAVPLTGDTGYFWFFSASNVELVVKVLDGRAINGKFWVFYGALSNVEYTITVTDTQTGVIRLYFNPDGSLASVADTAAF